MQKELPPWSEAAKSLKPGIYQHFKGGRYRLIGVAHHSETFEETVVYEHADGENNGLWIRPISMWNEYVDRDGYKGPRFRYVGA